MITPKEQQIKQSDINLIKLRIKQGVSYSKIQKETSWSVATICRIKQGYYDKERQCQTVTENPLEKENLFLKSEIERLKKELSTKEMLYRISNERRHELEEENKKLKALENNIEHIEPSEKKKTIKFGSHKTYDTDVSQYQTDYFSK